MRINLYIIIIIVFFFILIAIACIKNPIDSNNNQNTTQECTYNNYSEKEYVSKSIDECNKIKFECENSMIYFVDNCGCGCKLKGDENLVKVYCTDEQRDIEHCSAEKNPVCGWYNRNIKCLRFPCAQSYDNLCFACQDDKVYYWTQGECPQ